MYNNYTRRHPYCQAKTTKNSTSMETGHGKPGGMLPRVTAAAVLAFMTLSPSVATAATSVQIGGSISKITLTSPTDYWSAGTIIVNGQSVTIPRNLLIDLPANRLTLWQLFDQAPAACKALGETGLASTDKCNTVGYGGVASISANRTAAGNIIAGDMLIDKGQEVVHGVVTFINYEEGYLRINGTAAAAATPTTDPGTGLMARMNDPTSRHTIQSGRGCTTSTFEFKPGVTRTVGNCSPDPRFTNDPDNYTNVAVTGYPMCIPSRVLRTWAGLPAQGTGANASPAVAGGNTNSNTGTPGNGDALCPQGNRTANNLVADSRFMAPIKVGDSIGLEGNYEIINGVKFLSYHSSTTEIALETKPALSQPDYLAPDEVEQDAPGYENQRARTLLIGFSTLPPDVLLWTTHFDPVNNEAIEKPWASVRGCDIVSGGIGVGACGANGLVPGVGGHIWKIRYDIDFAAGASDPEVNPCVVINAETRFGTTVCPVNGNTAAGSIGEQLAIVMPFPREIIARTGHRLAALDAGIEPITLDINGEPATNGEYTNPMGVNLGGVGFPEWNEFDLTKMAAPFSFTALPWTLDRRLSPGGCKDGVCESTPQPLAPYPFEGVDPRIQTPIMPSGSYNDPGMTASALTNVRNRILSYVTPLADGTTDFNGDQTVLAWPPTDPAAFTIAATPAEVFCNSSTGSCATTVATPTCTAPLVFRNGGCVAAGLLDVVPTPTPPAVIAVVTPPVIPPTTPVVTPTPTVDTVTIEGVTWTEQGGRRGLFVVAKTSAPTGPTPQLYVTAFNNRNTVLSQTQMTQVTTNVNLFLESNAVPVIIGTVSCSVQSPCWQLPVTRVNPDKLKPTSVVVQSSKGGTATKLATNGPSF